MALLERMGEQLVESTVATDKYLKVNAGLGLVDIAIITAVIVGGIAVARWAFNKVGGKSSSVNTVQNETREKAAFAFA